MNGMVLPENGMRELALFAGAGGGILGGLLHGWRTVAAIEIEDYPRRVLLQRQADGILPRFPIWDDVRTFDGKPWRGKVDIITGGFPCQDISYAGKGAGISGTRSSLWFEMLRIITEVRPRFALIENTPGLIRSGLPAVLGGLSGAGYGGKGFTESALAVGAAHVRNRVWILADSSRIGWEWWWSVEQEAQILEYEGLGEEPFRERAIESGINGTGYAIPSRVDRLAAIGNAQIPTMAALAWETLSND